MLEVCEAGYAIGGRPILSSVSLAVRPGEVLGLIGHNGSGKSTLMALMAGERAPTTGRVVLAGRDIGRWSARARARQLSHLPQALPSAAGVTVRELVGFGRYAVHGALGRFGSEDRAAVADAMAATGVTPLAERFVEGLSGGERQRAWIAMQIAQGAGCLLLDEPTSALDLAHQMEVLGLLRTLARERGVAVAVVLHDLNMAARHCDMLLALKDGVVAGRGRPVDLLEPSMLRKVFSLDMLILAHPAGGAPVAVPA